MPRNSSQLCKGKQIGNSPITQHTTAFPVTPRRDIVTKRHMKKQFVVAVECM